jgi:hypothetical protein
MRSHRTSPDTAQHQPRHHGPHARATTREQRMTPTPEELAERALAAYERLCESENLNSGLYIQLAQQRETAREIEAMYMREAAITAAVGAVLNVARNGLTPFPSYEAVDQGRYSDAVRALVEALGRDRASDVLRPFARS